MKNNYCCDNNIFNLYKKSNIQCNDQKINYKSMKEYFKIKSNLEVYLKENYCSSFTENFELLKYINSGSSGVVYEGRHLKIPNKKVCLKFLLNKSLEEKRDKNSKQKSEIKEINIQNKLRDKNITEYYDYCNLNEHGCIIMEFAKYGDLDHFQKNLLQKQNLTETLLAYITKQILDGLNYIHKSKIIHMDIKQQNILIDEHLNIKITDFSVSFPYENFKEHDKIKLPLAGTSLYMSPEVLNKEKIDYEDCSKIDTFSLGILLYNAAFEQFPFDLDYSDKKNFNGIYRKIMNKALIFPVKKSYSLLFRKFLKGLLDKNIKNRLGIIEAMEDPWIKGTRFLYQEKEKLNDNEKFLINIITDNVKSFNDYLKVNNYESNNSTTIS